MTQVTSIAPTTDRAPIRGSTVTMEDGGRLQRFCHRATLEVVAPEGGWVLSTSARGRLQWPARPCSASSPLLAPNSPLGGGSLQPRPCLGIRLETGWKRTVFRPCLITLGFHFNIKAANRTSVAGFFYGVFAGPQADRNARLTAGPHGLGAQVPPGALAALPSLRWAGRCTWEESTLCGAVAAAPACLRPVPFQPSCCSSAWASWPGTPPLTWPPSGRSNSVNLEVRAGEFAVQQRRSWARGPGMPPATTACGWVLQAQALIGASPGAARSQTPNRYGCPWRGLVAARVRGKRHLVVAAGRQRFAPAASKLASQAGGLPYRQPA